MGQFWHKIKWHLTLCCDTQNGTERFEQNVSNTQMILY
jgi:hypothetical protein